MYEIVENAGLKLLGPYERVKYVLDKLSSMASDKKKLVFVALLVSLALATNYVLISVPNVKLMDFVTFLAGKTLGFAWGAATATLIWLVYGTINPYGFSASILPVLIVSEMSYCVAGSLVGNRFSGRSNKEKFFIYGIVGLLSTLIYDIATNAAVGILFYGSIITGLITMNFPLPMGLIHELSNAIMFPSLSLALEPYVKFLF
ncbi:MAG: hypothetical protein ACP5KW_03785 [Thermoproteota archaeon]|jgi:predicted membrane protein